jgi:hypothetical protein
MMKRRMAEWMKGGAAFAALSALAVALTGCGGSGDDAEEGGQARGEPIRGEPIATAPAVVDGKSEPASVAAAEPEKPAAEEDSAVAAEAEEKGGESVELVKGTPEKPLPVTFDKLAAFNYDVPDGPVKEGEVEDGKPQPSAKIPESVQALDEQYVSLKGFMLPLKVEKGLVTELLIMRDQSMCCYGTVPKINEWVSVKMVGNGVKPVMDQAVTLFGTLKVGEMYENGYLVGIYSMDGERMTSPLDM